ncbi:Lactase-phlorizin hydrolase [Folsomia candida]|uniref:Lactase-phlorizin hydrolase n=1 Tax=Folsomia candida TaxID=158441 RepID=A0A226EV44_FOLCA|nr:Lactase-phlorizin hydrolase [Folsomia candida]
MAGLRFFALILLIVGVSYTAGQEDDFLYGQFPDGFLWGLATSSGWDADGKGESGWDFWSHENNGSNIADGKNGDIACDSYNNYMADVYLLKNMGADFYRFSLSWARIIPTGKLSDGINPAGIQYYNYLIDGLIANEITPFITLYHWDLPMGLLNEGGWLNETIVEHFADFSRVVFDAFGDRVKFWLTFNEPHVFCLADWNYGIHDPFLEPPEKPYICAHNVIKSHARAFRIYDEEFRPSQNGQMGITLNCDWSEPKNQSDPEHMLAMDRSVNFRYGWWANPLLRGEYPAIMRELVDAKSEAEGRNSSRLPTFDSTWTEIITGTLDFLGLNHYSTHYVLPSDGLNGWMDGDANIRSERDPAWNSSGIGWSVVPWGLRNITTWVAREYQMPIYITENGYGAQESDMINDEERVNYYRAYINEVLKSIVYDGADVRAYTAWSLMDNYEWTLGYTARFGVHYVDFNHPARPRAPKQSAIELSQIFADNGFPLPK